MEFFNWRLAFKFDVDSKNGEKNLKEIHKEIKNLKNSEKEIKDFSSSITNASIVLSEFGSSFSNMGQGALDITSSFYRAAKGIDSYLFAVADSSKAQNDFMEIADKSLDSAEKFQRRMAEVRRFAALTPFDIREVKQATSILAIAGKDALGTINVGLKEGSNEQVKMLRLLGDFTAAFKSSGRSLMDIINIYRQIPTGAARMELKQMGISYRQLHEFSKKHSLATPFKEVNGEIQFINERGKEMEELFNRFIQHKFGGAMAKQMDLFSAQVQLSKDALTTFASKLMLDTGIYESRVKIMKKIVEALTGTKDSVKGTLYDPEFIAAAGDVVRDFAKYIDGVFSTIQKMIPILVKFIIENKKLISTIAKIGISIITILWPLGMALKIIGGFLLPINILATAIPTLIGMLTAFGATLFSIVPIMAAIGIGMFVLYRLAKRSGRTMIEQMGVGIVAGYYRLKLAFVRVFQKITDRLFPHSDAKEGPLSRLTSFGEAIMTTIAKGIRKGYGKIKEAISEVWATVMQYDLFSKIPTIGASIGWSKMKYGKISEEAFRMKDVGGIATGGMGNSKLLKRQIDYMREYINSTEKLVKMGEIANTASVKADIRNSKIMFEKMKVARANLKMQSEKMFSSEVFKDALTQGGKGFSRSLKNFFKKSFLEVIPTLTKYAYRNMKGFVIALSSIMSPLTLQAGKAFEKVTDWKSFKRFISEMDVWIRAIHTDIPHLASMFNEALWYFQHANKGMQDAVEITSDMVGRNWHLAVRHLKEVGYSDINKASDQLKALFQGMADANSGSVQGFSDTIKHASYISEFFSRFRKPLTMIIVFTKRLGELSKGFFSKNYVSAITDFFKALTGEFYPAVFYGITGVDITKYEYLSVLFNKITAISASMFHYMQIFFSRLALKAVSFMDFAGIAMGSLSEMSAGALFAEGAFPAITDIFGRISKFFGDIKAILITAKNKAIQVFAHGFYSPKTYTQVFTDMIDSFKKMKKNSTLTFKRIAEMQLFEPRTFKMFFDEMMMPIKEFKKGNWFKGMTGTGFNIMGLEPTKMFPFLNNMLSSADKSLLDIQVSLGNKIVNMFKDLKDIIKDIPKIDLGKDLLSFFKDMATAPLKSFKYLGGAGSIIDKMFTGGGFGKIKALAESQKLLATSTGKGADLVQAIDRATDLGDTKKVAKLTKELKQVEEMASAITKGAKLKILVKSFFGSALFFDYLLNKIFKYLPGIISLVGRLFGSTKPLNDQAKVLIGYFNFLKEIFLGIVTLDKERIFQAMSDQAIEGARAIGNSLYNAFITAGKGLWSVLKVVFSVFDFIDKSLEPIFDWILFSWFDLEKGMGGFLKLALDFISAIGGFIQYIGPSLEQFMRTITTLVGKIINLLLSKGMAAYLKSLQVALVYIRIAFKLLGFVLSPVIKALANIVDIIISAFLPALESMFEGIYHIYSFMENLFLAVEALIDGETSKISSLIKAAFTNVFKAAAILLIKVPWELVRAVSVGFVKLVAYLWTDVIWAAIKMGLQMVVDSLKWAVVKMFNLSFGDSAEKGARAFQDAKNFLFTMFEIFKEYLIRSASILKKLLSAAKDIVTGDIFTASTKMQKAFGEAIAMGIKIAFLSIKASLLNAKVIWSIFTFAKNAMLAPIKFLAYSFKSVMGWIWETIRDGIVWLFWVLPKYLIGEMYRIFEGFANFIIHIRDTIFEFLNYIDHGLEIVIDYFIVGVEAIKIKIKEIVDYIYNTFFNFLSMAKAKYDSTVGAIRESHVGSFLQWAGILKEEEQVSSGKEVTINNEIREAEQKSAATLQQNQQQTIIVQVDGKEVARATNKHNREYNNRAIGGGLNKFAYNGI